MKRRTLLAGVLALTLAAPAMAQDDWPTRAITIIGGFPAGAGTDIYARKLGEELSKSLGVPFVADNRTGAGGNVAADIVARSNPDGYTFMLSTSGTHAINAALYKSLAFDVEKDFTRVALLGDVPNVLLVNPKKHPDIKTCSDLIALIKANPGKLNYSSTGNGASGHLAGAQFTHLGDLKVVHVPYRGQGPAMTALLSGEVDFFFNQVAPSMGFINSGELRPLGVTLSKPIDALPDVKTIEDACNMPGYESSTWYGIFAPAGLPKPILTRMNAEITKVVKSPEFDKWLRNTQGITPPEDMSLETFERIHKADIKRWAKMVEISGARVD